uniref:Complement C1s n=1 Tax=Sphenodon punctatus TaxID=8508 RepID=A0A8D0LA26_SPHPU
IWKRLFFWVDAAPLHGEILSPNYPQGYPNDVNEIWNISVASGYGIRLYFTHLDIEPSQDCEYDSVKILSGDHVVGRLCGQKKRHDPGSPILEEFYVPDNRLTVTFQSDFSNEQRFTGFAAYYVTVDVNECKDFAEDTCSHYCNNYVGGYFCSCPPQYFLHEDRKTCGVNCSGNVFTDLSGEITSPNYPSPYPENSHCDYHVTLEPGYRVVLSVRHGDFDLEPADSEGNCPDSLTFTAGDRRFGPFCGNSFPWPEIKTKSNVLDIVFQTDNSVQSKGWKLRYFADPIPCPRNVTSNSVLDPIKDNYIFQDYVTVTCVEGYEVVTQKSSFKAFHSSCQSNGQWSNSHFKCIPVDCGIPDSVDNGNVVYLSAEEETHYKAVIRYVCEEPYYSLQTKGDGRCFPVSDSRPDTERCPTLCGVPSTPIVDTQRIFGGSPAEPGNFPWQVFFQSPLGGGALISDRWVLTAAHVVEERHPSMYAGVSNLDSLQTATALQEDQVFIHPNWPELESSQIRTDFDNDIALVRLSKPVKMGPLISPLCLPGASLGYEPRERALGYIAGWGRTEKHTKAKRVRAKNLMKAKIPIVNMDRCRNEKPDALDHALIFRFTDNMICAGEGGRDSCDGDSGGAFAFADPLNRTRYYVAGLVSWGPKCGTYGIYTKVVNYLDWITETMKRPVTPSIIPP